MRWLWRTSKEPTRANDTDGIAGQRTITEMANLLPKHNMRLTTELCDLPNEPERTLKSSPCGKHQVVAGRGNRPANQAQQGRTARAHSFGNIRSSRRRAKRPDGRQAAASENGRSRTRGRSHPYLGLRRRIR